MRLCLIVAIFYMITNAECDSFDKINSKRTSEVNEKSNKTKLQHKKLNNLVEETCYTIGERASTLVDICDDGKIEAALQTIDNTIYIFKRFGFLIVDLDGGSKANKSYITRFTWPKIKHQIEYAFTITDPDNHRYGSSILAKNNKLYEYKNTEFLGVISTRHWDERIDHHLKPFYYFGDSIFSFYDQHYSSIDFFGKYFFFLDFHNLEQPEILSFKSVPNLPNYFAYINQIVPLNDDRWLVFLSYDTYGSYCIVYNVSTTDDFICEEKSLNKLIDCPFIAFKSNQVILKALSRNQDLVLFTIRGILVASLYGLSILYVLTYFNYIDSKLNSKSKLEYRS